ncbi:MAG TPA: hypothetical protein VD965_06645 [Burkholderiales bacterium]|nr:hypothetical protein [Burkholderiales bacterium]
MESAPKNRMLGSSAAVLLALASAAVAGWALAHERLVDGDLLSVLHSLVVI